MNRIAKDPRPVQPINLSSLALAIVLEVVGGIALVRRWDLVGKRAALLLSRMMRSPRERLVGGLLYNVSLLQPI